MEPMPFDPTTHPMPIGNDGALTLRPRVGYRDNQESPRNQVQSIPSEENCCVWIMGLPANCTYTEFLGKLHGTGKIWATYINPPTDFHSTAAAKVEFWNRRGMRRLFQKVHARQFTFGEYRPHVIMNRVRKSGHVRSAGSRAITIRGPSSLVNFESLTAFFGARLRYELEFANTVHDDGEQATMLWAFGSYRCQAKWAYQNLDSLKQDNPILEENELWGQVTVSWAVDPCST
ncbi:uncharacterized protein F4822DRAFT_393638 [Hypoxylon trugodes]|uniref:uncharacterized protein n=1 Tax=Hypoxylon trugodes TaxID=326681 RepID=UPI00219D1122|nr:uncharacterized protein F4822DRAFT_393638 [Hypoxylon trugodes]KAI1390581.1 hypothetical protein F4822DRAFT_393638 [Hypoxylon trugodes]